MALTRLAELLGRLSLAFDISSDFPHGKAVRSTVLATELGKRAGASEEEIRDTYWGSLLSNLGCTGFAHDEGLRGAGDDRSLRSGMSMFSIEDPLRSASEAFRRIAPDVSFARRLHVFAGILSDRTLFERFQRAMCDTSIHLAQMVGAGPRVLTALEQLCERWDGRGVPGRVEGDSMVLPFSARSSRSPKSRTLQPLRTSAWTRPAIRNAERRGRYLPRRGCWRQPTWHSP